MGVLLLVLLMAACIGFGFALGRLLTPQAAAAASARAPLVRLSMEDLTRLEPRKTPAVPNGLPGDQIGLTLLNRDRADAGLPALTESLALNTVAQQRAQQLADSGFGHFLPRHSIMAEVELLRAAGIRYTWHGENIFWSSGDTIEETIRLAESWWMDDPEHRDNILGTHYGQVGIGVVVSNGRTYVVQDFTD